VTLGQVQRTPALHFEQGHREHALANLWCRPPYMQRHSDNHSIVTTTRTTTTAPEITDGPAAQKTGDGESAALKLWNLPNKASPDKERAPKCITLPSCGMTSHRHRAAEQQGYWRRVGSARYVAVGQRGALPGGCQSIGNSVGRAVKYALSVLSCTWKFSAARMGDGVWQKHTLAVRVEPAQAGTCIASSWRHPSPAEDMSNGGYSAGEGWRERTLAVKVICSSWQFQLSSQSAMIPRYTSPFLSSTVTASPGLVHQQLHGDAQALTHGLTEEASRKEPVETAPAGCAEAVRKESGGSPVPEIV